MKHVMLFFLSDIHLQKETKQFQHTIYNEKFDCVQTNESAIDYLSDQLSKNDEKIDALFYFLSKKTREPLEVCVNGQNIKNTHAEWFMQRVREKISSLPPGFFRPVEFDESQDKEESIRQVIKMTEKIKEYAAYSSEQEGEELCVHADMTGGFRHASMMMLSVMQLLKYSGIEIENVFYSNWQKGIVEEVTEIHRMFSLVSGADEFVNFGSVTEIENYFADRYRSPSLDNLLKKMREFSDAVKICRTNTMETVVKELGKCIRDFTENKEKSLQEDLFNQLVSTLKEEYGALLMPEVTRPDIIRWCIRKGFLQQAMTLCTEWLPFILVEKKACYAANKEVEEDAAQYAKKMHREWQQTFIISYYRECRLISGEGSSKKNGGFRAAVEQYINSKNVEESAVLYPQGEEGLLRLFSECKENENIFSLTKTNKLSWAEFEQKVPVISKACQIEWEKLTNDPNYNTNFYGFVMKLKNVKNLLNRVANFSKERQTSLLAVNRTDDGSNLLEKQRSGATQIADAKNSDAAWYSRKKQYRKLFDAGIMKTDYPCDVMDILKGYNDIREERNKINHATKDKDKYTLTSEKIGELMTDYLELLHKVIQI